MNNRNIRFILLRGLALLIFTVFSVSTWAQRESAIINNHGAVRFVPGSALLQTNPATGSTWQAVGSPFITTPAQDYSYQGGGEIADTSSVSIASIKPQGEEKSRGALHGSVGLSIMAGFGKGAPHGAGFAQNVNLDYTAPLGKRGWLTVGGYMNHLNWGGINITNGGLYGELGYNFNEHWSAYIYGQKSLANSGMAGYGYPYYYGYPGFYDYYDGCFGYNPFGDRLGAAVRWTPNHNFSLQISVEKDWYPKSGFGYNRKYDYQK